MKFIIDTDNKSIMLQESANFGTFVDIMQQMLGDSWKEYKLEQVTNFAFRSYINIQPIIYPSIPAWKPFWEGQPSIIYGTTAGNSNNVCLTSFTAK